MKAILRMWYGFEHEIETEFLGKDLTQRVFVSGAGVPDPYYADLHFVLSGFENDVPVFCWRPSAAERL